MQGMSEDEGDADDQPEIKVDEEKNEAARKAREERAVRLRKMMEDDGKPSQKMLKAWSNAL
jgi:DNA polymerase delta subunit 3